MEDLSRGAATQRPSRNCSVLTGVRCSVIGRGGQDGCKGHLQEQQHHKNNNKSESMLEGGSGFLSGRGWRGMEQQQHRIRVNKSESVLEGGSFFLSG
jgi:hypothetical protein